MARYDRYKPSGVEWLGEVPEGWGVVRVKEIFSERVSTSGQGNEELLTVSHITGVTPRTEKTVNMFLAESFENYKQCFAGDLVINTMWAWMGALGVSKVEGICSPAYGVYRPRSGVPYEPSFFDYLLRIPNCVAEITRWSKGIVSSRLRLYSREFFQIVSPLPSLSEQQAIAAYLDDRTAHIDRQVTLLQEKADHFRALRQSLINRVVTQGLDPSVPMKDSGVEWVGTVPRHWTSPCRIKDVATARPSNVDKNSVEGESTVRLCNYVDVYKNDFITHDMPFMEATASEADIRKFRLFEGDVIITKDSEQELDIAQVAFVASSAPNLVCGYHLNLIRPNPRHLDGRFLARLFSSDRWHDQFELAAKGITRVSLGAGIIQDALLSLPPLPEQQAIAAYLDEKCGQIDAIVAAVEKQISTLKELRRALINEVVTGQRKVV